jgi:hypothetical protein
MGERTLFAAVLLACIIAPSVRTQPSPAAGARLEGDWVRIDPDGVGSFDGLSGVVPAAQLRSGVTGGGRGDARGGRGGREGAEPTGPHPEGVPYIVVAQPCSGFGGGRGNGGLLVNPDSGGVHFIEHKDEVIFAGERGGVRHIYLDRRGHPDPSHRAATPAGHSIGRYEGGTLIVETTGFTAGAVPGGGVRTPETRLVERFELSPDGQRLTIVYTWDDPKIYQKPHVYRLYFERAPAVKSNGALVSYALEEWCDAGDPIEKQSIIPPKQTIK